MIPATKLWRYVITSNSDCSPILPFDVQTAMANIDCPFFYVGKHPHLGYFAIMSEEGPVLWSERNLEDVKTEKRFEKKITEDPPKSRYEILRGCSKENESNMPTAISISQQQSQSRQGTILQQKVKRRIRWKMTQ